MHEQDCEQLTFFQGDSPVNRSPLPGSAEARRMTVTSGRKCLELLKSCGLLGLLEKTLLESSIWRSTRCYLTWRPKATKQGRLLFQLAVSMPRTAETGSQLWLGTMTASQTGGNHSLRSPERMKGRTPSPAEFVMMWPTPRAKESGDYQYSAGNHDKPIPTLSGAVKLCPMPTSREYKGGRRPETLKSKGRTSSNTLCDAVNAVMYATPQARDFRTGQQERFFDPKRSKNLNDQIGGQLNPTWVEWLMGFPTGWTDLDA